MFGRLGAIPSKVAVVQICVDNDYCDVMHIIHSGIPQSLKHIIEDSTLVKVCLIFLLSQMFFVLRHGYS